MARRRTPTVHVKKQSLDAVRNEINVTPLVDVVLVLLIIFMVVMPEMSRGVDVTLPKTRNHAEKQDTGDQAVVSIKGGPGGRVDAYFGNDFMGTNEQLKEAMERYLHRKPGEPIFVKADINLSYGDIYPLLLVMNEAGAGGIELGTDDISQGAE